MTCHRFCVPITTPSLTNLREFWAKRAARTKAHRDAVALLWPKSIAYQAGHRVHVLLTRIGQRRLDDDNIRGALKAVRDEVATQLGIDDGAGCVRWEYAQRTGRKLQPAVEVEVTT